MKRSSGGALALSLMAATATAQLRVPALPITLPTQALQNGSQLLDAMDARLLERLSAVRQLEIDRLIGRNRRVIDVDPDGNPIVRGEILASSPSDAALAHALAMDFVVVRELAIDSMNIHLVVFRGPESLSTGKQLRRLRDADPQGLYDYNHIYLGSADSSSDADAPPAPQNADLRAPAKATAASHMRVGLLDTGVDISHPAFHDATIRSFGCADKLFPAAHGTAVASLLVGQAPGFSGVQPEALLFAADVYCGQPTGGAVDALIGAFAWMVQEQVPVINVSLVGPKNLMLQQVVSQLVAGGFIIVAAVGNDGPAAAPLYPAAYPNVVGVTAVDLHHRVLIEALRGPQVMFASMGADLAAAGMDHGYVAVRGTSFAAPFVAGLLAAELPRPSVEQARAAIDALTRTAIHLGSPGRDLTYGYGLVGAQFRIDPAPLTHR
jgi:hypothetical protein